MRMRQHGLVAMLAVAAIAMLSGASTAAEPGDAASAEGERPLRWWKGNLHTHSLWSDGDDFPEMIADWYAQRDYNFLALSDHNVLSQGIRWMPLKTIRSRGSDDALDKYRQRFGDAWVETRGEPGSDDLEVRLKPLDEFRCLVEQRGQFIMIPGEEISDRADGKPVHMNATNLLHVIEPAGGATVREAMQNNLRAVLEQEKETGRQILPHLNHPNFHYAITAEDLAAVVAERFYEVFNGHPGVNHLGDHDHPSVERIWDLANAIRLTQLSAEPLMGVGTDDSHEYHGRPGSRPGRGWVMVRSRYLTPEHLIRAMKAGDFYASSGVTLSDVRFDESNQTLALDIQSDDGASYETQFIGTLRSATGDASADKALPAPEAVGVVLATVKGLQPRYTMTGKELYVRAAVTSSRPHPDPAFDDQKEQAWTQPVGWKLPAQAEAK